MHLDGAPLGRHPRHGPSCFGCGEQHPAGLRMRFVDDGRTTRALVAFPASFADARGLVPEGVVLAALHEAMHHAAWARKLGDDVLGDGTTGLFAKGVRADAQAVVEAWPGRRSGTGYFWYARLLQDGDERANCETWLRPRATDDA